jgi:hypothetical protein
MEFFCRGKESRRIVRKIMTGEFRLGESLLRVSAVFILVTLILGTALSSIS